MTEHNPTYLRETMWGPIGDAFDTLTKVPDGTKIEGWTTDRTVKWSLYRLGLGLLRLDLRAAIGTFAADMKRDPQEEP